MEEKNDYYVLVSLLRNELKIIEVDQDIEKLTESIKKNAIEWVYDEIGKRNYIDTLSDDVPPEKCPLGYVLKWGFPDPQYNVGVTSTLKTTNEDDETQGAINEPETITHKMKKNPGEITRISVYLNAKVKQHGWILNYRVRTTEHIGYFAVLKIENVRTSMPDSKKKAQMSAPSR